MSWEGQVILGCSTGSRALPSEEEREELVKPVRSQSRTGGLAEEDQRECAVNAKSAGTGQKSNLLSRKTGVWRGKP